MKLYYTPGTCSLAPIILAEWLELPLEIERVNHRDPSPEYQVINPLGAVPALLTDEGRTRTQVDAILQYFCSLRPGSGLDAAGDIEDKFELHRWVAFLTGDFHPPFGGWFKPARFTTDQSEEAVAAVKQGFENRVRRVTDVLEAQVGNDSHIALGRRTLLDAYAYAMVRWLMNLEDGFGPWPNLERFMQTMSKDTGVQRAMAREKSGH
jgi:glutathione S-transferase